MGLKSLDKKKVHRSLGAIAGLTSALSIIVGALAAAATPRGWGRVSMALHFTKKPLILKLAPLLTGVSTTVVTAVGIMGFYLWLVERDEAQAANSPSPNNLSLNNLSPNNLSPNSLPSNGVESSSAAPDA